jgi:hypothetical protein
MVQVQLNSEEGLLLKKVLTSYFSDLRMEIADTDSLDYRDMLKKEENFLRRLLETLDAELAREGQPASTHL